MSSKTLGRACYILGIVVALGMVSQVTTKPVEGVQGALQPCNLSDFIDGLTCSQGEGPARCGDEKYNYMYSTNYKPFSYFKDPSTQQCVTTDKSCSKISFTITPVCIHVPAD